MTLALTAVVFFLSLGTAYGVWLFRVLKIARKAQHPSAIGSQGCLVVPGKRLVGDQPDADFRSRLTRAAELAQSPHVGSIVILGGKTAAATIAEAEAGKHYLAHVGGLDPGRIEMEALSLNTLTNLRNVRDLLRSKAQAPQTITIISNRYHLARLGLIAESLAIEHRLEPAEPVLPLTASAVLQLSQESLYCLWFVVGKTWARVTRNRRMLARIT